MALRLSSVRLSVRRKTIYFDMKTSERTINQSHDA